MTALTTKFTNMNICRWPNQASTFPSQHDECDDPVLLQRLGGEAEACTGQQTTTEHVWISVWDWGKKETCVI